MKPRLLLLLLLQVVRCSVSRTSRDLAGRAMPYQVHFVLLLLLLLLLQAVRY
jgi:hypothetical protein